MKFRIINCPKNNTDLLIEPQGIEISNLNKTMNEFIELLIEPQGIEMLSRLRVVPLSTLLIEPQGIEILYQMRIRRVQITFNRTTRN